MAKKVDGKTYNRPLIENNLKQVFAALAPHHDGFINYEQNLKNLFNTYLPYVRGGGDKEDLESVKVAQFKLAKYLVDIYGNNKILKSSIDTVESSDVNSALFGAYAHTAGSFETAIIIFSLIMVIVLIIIITSTLITDNYKSFAVLKLIGYRKRDISKVFLVIYIPFLILGVIIGIIVAYALITSFVYLTLWAVQIYLPISLSIISLVVAIFGIGLIFVSTFLSSIYSLNRLEPLKVLE
jgi:ABC-type antimicrobial peptide transport system permease subunit